MNNRTITRRTIQRLLDRKHLGIFRCCTYEVKHRHVEVMKRMMNQQVVVANDRENIGARLFRWRFPKHGQSRMRARPERPILQVRAIDVAHRNQIAQPDG